MAAAYGFTPAGFVVKTSAAIIADMQQAIWNTIDPELDLSAQTPDGQMLGIVGNQIGSAWELIGIAANQYNREDAEGAALDNLGDIVGIPREGESFTQVYCELTISAADAPYLAGSLVANIAGLPSQTFSNFVDVTAAMISGGTAPGVLFQATVIGATPSVNPGTLTAITTPVTGWTSITNPGAQSQLGAAEELDPAYGPRQEAEVGAEGSCTPSATAAALVELGAAQTPPQTLSVSVLQNTTPSPITVSGLALPPHTYAVVIDDGGTTWASGTTIAQTVTLSNASTSVTFSAPPALTAGTALSFASQPGVLYALSADTSGTSGTLTQPYSGTGGSAIVATIPGAGWALIGQTIYNNKPAGIETIGSVAITVLDPILGYQTVLYSVPTPVALYITMYVVPRASVTSFTALQGAIITALQAAATSLTPANGEPLPGQLAPGSPAIGSQLQAVVAATPGVQDVFGTAATPGSPIKFGTAPSPSNTAPISFTALQVGQIVGANVTITEATGVL